MSASPEYTIRRITKDDTEPILQHLRKFFFTNEPLNASVKLIEYEGERCIDLEKYCIKAMNCEISYVAVTDTNEIICVDLNTIYNIKEPKEDEEQHSDPKFIKVGKFLSVAGGNGTKAILEKFPECNKILDVKVLSTDSKFAGKGIAGKLIEMGRKSAQDHRCDLMRIDCSSYFSARVAEKLGFQMVYELPFADYQEDGKPVFPIPHPHTSATTYVQKLTPP